MSASKELTLFAAGILSGGVLLYMFQQISSSKEKHSKSVKEPQQPTVGTIQGKVSEKIGNEQEIDPEIYKEQFVRNRKFFGEEGQDKVENSFVIVVGLGGVGSHAANMIVRSGVSHIRLIDFDQVSVSSLNRHISATQVDVGRSKVEVLREQFSRICPKAKVEVMAEMFEKDTADELLSGNPDFVLDCIDNLETKADLIKYCTEHDLPLISSMGAGAKADPSSICIGLIDNAEGDELAVSIRRELRKRKVYKPVPVVYSTEKSRMKLLPLEAHQEEDPDAYKPIASLRVRVIPVLGCMPAAFGNAMASYVLCAMAEKPLELRGHHSLTRHVVHKLHQQLEGYLRKINFDGKVEFCMDDLEYVCNSIYFGVSCLSGKKTTPTVTLWDSSKPCTLDNVVLLTRDERDKHVKLESLDELNDVYVKKVHRHLADIRTFLETRPAMFKASSSSA